MKKITTSSIVRTFFTNVLPYLINLAITTIGVFLALHFTLSNEEQARLDSANAILRSARIEVQALHLSTITHLHYFETILQQDFEGTDIATALSAVQPLTTLNTLGYALRSDNVLRTVSADIYSSLAQYYMALQMNLTSISNLHFASKEALEELQTSKQEILLTRLADIQDGSELVGRVLHLQLNSQDLSAREINDRLLEIDRYAMIVLPRR